MADGIEGLSDLFLRLQQLPVKLQNKTLVGWATGQANRMASRLRIAAFPKAFKTGRTVGSIRGKRVRPAVAKSMFHSIARALAYASNKNGGALWSILNRGTAPRFARADRNSISGQFTRATNREIGRPAYRGRGPALRIVDQSGPAILQAILPEAKQDLAKRIERAFRKHGGE